MNRVQKQYIARRRKEDWSFLVIRFMRAHILFSELYQEFKALQSKGGDFQNAGLFSKVRNLEQTLVFDIKEKAHFLFRSDRQDAAEPGTVGLRFADLESILLQNQKADRTKAREVFAELRKLRPLPVHPSSAIVPPPPISGHSPGLPFLNHHSSFLVSSPYPPLANSRRFATSVQ